MNISGIYKIQSLIKPKRIYIGSAKDIYKRWECHVRTLRKNKHHSAKLQYHYNKYGESDLQFSILLGCDKSDLLKIEQYYLDYYKPYFNIYMVAGSPLGFKMPPEVIEKMRQAFLGEKNPNYGRHFSEEHRRKLSKSKKGISVNKGHRHTEEAKRKMSEARKGKPNPHKGYRPSDEGIAEIKRKLKGRIPWNKGKKYPHNGYPHTKEQKEKVSESLREFYRLKKNNVCSN